MKDHSGNSVSSPPNMGGFATLLRSTSVMRRSSGRYASLQLWTVQSGLTLWPRGTEHDTSWKHHHRRRPDTKTTKTDATSHKEILFHRATTCVHTYLSVLVRDDVRILSGIFCCVSQVDTHIVADTSVESRWEGQRTESSECTRLRCGRSPPRAAGEQRVHRYTARSKARACVASPANCFILHRKMPSIWSPTCVLIGAAFASFHK